MASDALISAVVNQLISYAQQQVTLVTGARDAVGNLTVTLKLIQGVVADAEEKQLTDSAVKVWLAELKDVIYAADDVLDEWYTKTALSHLQTGDVDSNLDSAGSTSWKKVLSLLLSICPCIKDASVRYDIGGQIKGIRERLDILEKQGKHYDLVASNSQYEPPSITPLTSSFFDASEIRGRDGDKQTIKDMLLSGSSSSEGPASIHVISIVGTGGFGKTTLAKLVFNDKLVETAFEIRIWVCISQPFDISRIAKEIMEQAMKNVPAFTGVQAMCQHLSNSVKGKRFLLVLDDVWTNDPQHWTPLKLSLGDGASGSRILVTTRNREVATMMESTHIHDLAVLGKEDSWSLFSHLALKGSEEKLLNFEKIGREIAFKCKGVPLAIQTLGRFLCDKRSIQDWRDVANSNLWEMSKIKEFFLPSLFISFFSLPPISKQCFLYCSVFKKDSVMYKSDLVELWMAQGFFGYGGNTDLEKTGEYHFDILAMRSFFQDFELNSDEKIVSCKMHDVVHDFAQFLSRGETMNEERENTEFDGRKVRHLLTNSPNDISNCESKNLRSLLGPNCTTRFPGPDVGFFPVPDVGFFPVPDVGVYGKLLCLRTLDLSGSDLKELPSEVSKLLHLRYLDLSLNESLLELPESICSLYNLQTLKLNRCRRLFKLPERIGDLSNLRHLHNMRTYALTYLPQGCTRLIFLRTLSEFTVGGLNGECKVGDLQHLPKLQGSLTIECLEKISDGNEAAKARLKEKRALDELRLVYRARQSSLTLLHIKSMNSVLESLEPPEYLKTLHIRYYQGDKFPSWMHDSSLLNNLVYLRLWMCVNCTQLPTLGTLGSLEKLRINSLRSVKHVGPEFLGGQCHDGVVLFPKLKSLALQSMSGLEQWYIPPFSPEGTSTVQIMPNLRHLSLYQCSKLRELPHYFFPPSLRELYIRDCPELKGRQPYLPPLLEGLTLIADVGVFSEILPLNQQSPSSINFFSLSDSPHSSFPKGVNQLTALQTLEVYNCRSLDSDLTEFHHLPTTLRIADCPILERRLKGEE